MNPRYRRAYALTCAALIGVAVLIAAQVALRTRPDVHPDEYWHANAFSYFEQHWWPPDLNADSLDYDPYGSNRIYFGEDIYLLYGRLAAVLRPSSAATDSQPASAVSDQPSALPPVADLLPLYRLFNTTLLLVTLVVLAAAGWRHPPVLALGLTIICVPQIVYVYSYANTDAWGLSISLLLFVFALTQRQVFTGYAKPIGLGVLVGLVLAAKQTYWLSLPLTALVLAARAWPDWRGARWPEGYAALARAAAVVALVAVIVMAPFRIIYPHSQGDFTARELAMREARAMDGLKPSHPTLPGLRLAERGVPLTAVLLDQEWYDRSAWSFYGLFGYMSVPLTDRLYHLGFGLGLLNIGLTLFLAFKPGSAVSRTDRLLLLGALGTIALCVGASLFNSWTYDDQPQGRYLFGAVPALAVLLWGSFRPEPRWARLVRLGSAGAAVALAVFILVRYILLNGNLLA